MQKNLLSVLIPLCSLAIIITSCAPAPVISEPTLVPATASPQPQLSATPPPAPTATTSPVPTSTPLPLACNIVFDSDRDQNLEIYVMGPDGSHPVDLTNNPGDDFDPVWSPDGGQIAFVSNRVTDAGGGQFIFMMLSDGSDVVQVSHQDESQSPDWSALGDQIAYSNKGDIYLVNLPEHTEVNLTKSPERDSQPKFSPDGRQIAWLKGEGNNTQLFVMDLEGGNARQLTYDGTVYGAEWTVDGRILANWDNPTGLCHNCVITADGADVSGRWRQGYHPTIPALLDGRRRARGTGFRRY